MNKKYAIIQSGGKQYIVPKTNVAIDLLDAEIGSTVEFKEILYFSDGQTPSTGGPTLDKCTVTGELVEHIKGEKIFGMKYKRRKQNFRAWGHRQRYSLVKIRSIDMQKQEHKHEHKKEAKHGT